MAVGLCWWSVGKGVVCAMVSSGCSGSVEVLEKLARSAPVSVNAQKNGGLDPQPIGRLSGRPMRFSPL
jgi:hypothetical protein